MIDNLWDRIKLLLLGKTREEPKQRLKKTKYRFKYVPKKRTFLLNNLVIQPMRV